MRQSPSIAAAVAAAAACLYVIAVWAGSGEATLRHAWDILWPAGHADQRVVVVAIDDESVGRVGEWPWPRATQASLVEMIADAGAKAVAYDVLLPGSEAGDADLARAMSTVPTVAAVGYSSAYLGDRPVFTASGPVSPTEAIASVTAPGHVLVAADSDGVVRTIPMVIEVTGGQFVGSLALRAVDLADGPANQIFVRPDAVQIGDRLVPTEQGAVLRVHWPLGLTAGDPRVLSAASVLDGSADSGLLDGAVVFVGATAVALGDRHVTPLSPGVSTPGVIAQASVASTILAATWVAPVPPWMSILLVLIAGFGLAWAALRWKLRWVLVAAITGAIAYLFAAVIIFGMFGVLGDVTRVPVALIGCLVATIGVRLIVEQRARRETVELFRRYVPEKVAVELLRTGKADDIAAGQRVIVGLVFCDLRGFTPLAGRLEPTAVRQILDAYYDYACTIVFAHGGTVMQFVGDEVFAVFGAPEPSEDPAAAARETGVHLQAGAGALRAVLAAAGLPPVEFGVGVHVGEVVAAHVGPVHRRQYAVIGDAVNVGSRLCGIAEAGEVVASERIAAGESWIRQTVTLKGIENPVTVVRWATEASAPVGADVDRAGTHT
jgi:adenylate cyclase